MIDLHCHLLPGVDDGSRTVEQSVQVLSAMREVGITAVCLTPHFSAGRIAQGIPRSHDLAFAALRVQAPEGVTLHRGVELMLDRPLPQDAAAARGLTLGGTRYLLVEFNHMVAGTAAAYALHQAADLGFVPVLAHPERYAACSPSSVSHWRALGARMQVDATTVFQPTARGRRARELLAHGLADVLAADNHGDTRFIAAPYRLLAEQGGVKQADLLCVRNPAAILGNGDVEPVPPINIKTGLLAKIRQFLDSGQ